MKTFQNHGLGFFTILSGALLASGCISVQETRYNDPPRLAVEFVSDHSARIFYETLHAAKGAAMRTEKHSTVSLILINVDERTVEGPNRFFNDAVRFCDTNADGEVTDFEADVFAREWPKAVAKE